jgi:hypothetical protein
MTNPFAFRVNDESMRKDTAANYIPPVKRKEMKEYLSGSSLWLPKLTEAPTRMST